MSESEMKIAYQLDRRHRRRTCSLYDRQDRRCLHLAPGAWLSSARELRELMRKGEDIDAYAIIRVDYQNDGVIRIDETGVNLKRAIATGIAVKLSCAA
jgi:hypothetical protein